MKKHVTNKILAAYIADALRPSERDRVDEHINQCGQCRARRAWLVEAIAPRYSSLKPGDQVKEKILRSLEEIKNGTAKVEQGVIRSLVERRPKTAIAAAVGAAAAIVILGFFIMQAQRPVRASLIMSRSDVGVTADGMPVRAGDRVYESSKIRLPDSSVGQLLYDNMIQITLINKGDCDVDRFSIGKDSRLNLMVTLHDGMLVSAIHGGKSPIAYEYITPNARIEPLGTEFLLQTDAGLTLAIIKEGAIRVTNLRSGKSIVLDSGRKCIISDSFIVMTANKEDMRMFEDFDNVKKGAYARLLLPAIFAQEAPAYTGKQNNTEKESGDAWKDGTKNLNENVTTENNARERAREERDRERRQQRMDQKKMQMNEMRRTNRTNMNQQLRKGR